ncbi:MAG: hypothetical protein LC733_03950 [Actinobacteria bacterium]|nr:hypothetical protein [Actinomycetota bacterium]
MGGYDRRVSRTLGILLTVTLGLAGCTDDGDSEVGAPARTSPGTTPPSSMTVSRTDEEAVAAFVRAWSQEDVSAMRAVATEAAVETALHFKDPTGPTDCSKQPNGQHQCIVAVASDKRLYLLTGEPGDVEGRVWWVSQYVPGS